MMLDLTKFTTSMLAISRARVLRYTVVPMFPLVDPTRMTNLFSSVVRLMKRRMMTMPKMKLTSGPSLPDCLGRSIGDAEDYLTDSGDSTGDVCGDLGD